MQMGRRRDAKMRSQKTCLFVRNYKICDVQILVNVASLGGLFLMQKLYQKAASEEVILLCLFIIVESLFPCTERAKCKLTGAFVPFAAWRLCAGLMLCSL